MEDEEEKIKEPECKPEGKKKIIKKFRENPWILSTLIVGVLLLILFASTFSGRITGTVISGSEAGEIILDLANSQIEGEVELVGVKEENGLYEVTLSMQGEEFPVYLTLDGENLVSGLTPIFVLKQQNQESPDQTQQSEEYSVEELEKISTFVDCLAEKNVKIYGANWCGWTKKLVVETFGGFDVTAPIYVECTENEELCSSEGVEGYPTIKIDNELYGGSRTFEGFAEATGCSAPKVSNVESSSTEEATCE